jgi:CSLREA domain-containing protein
MIAYIVQLFFGTAIALAIAFLPLVMPTAARAAPPGLTFTVTSAADLPDTDVGDGVCLASNGLCTLRAAIMQANFVPGPDTIILPSGVYLLTRPGDDDMAVLGDLDITDDLTILGAGSSTTIVDGNGNVTGDRVFQILSSAKQTSLSGLTIRNGKKISNAFDEGGGLYWDGGGGHLRLIDVVFENNSAHYGGGLFLNYSSLGDVVDMNQVIVRANTATTATGGGLAVNFGESARFNMRSSQVYGNTAHQGGGIYLQGAPTFGLLSARIEFTEIYSNSAGLSAGIENHSGNTAVPVVILNSHVHDNTASAYGGAIGNYGTLQVVSSTLDANTAGIRGGGFYNYDGGHAEIKQSTFSANTAQSGGGIYSELFIQNGATMTVTNSTLSGNTASHDGGGMYADGGQISFFNATIAGNHVVVPVTPPEGMGGGFYITASATIALQNTLLANNTHGNGVASPVPDDCFGSVRFQGYNLIRTLTNCSFVNPSVGDITGMDPVLGPLQFNGGTTQTLALLPGSPAIDAGRPTGCNDAAGTPILTDQRGAARPFNGRCDIGAYEYRAKFNLTPFGITPILMLLLD